MAKTNEELEAALAESSAKLDTLTKALESLPTLQKSIEALTTENSTLKSSFEKKDQELQLKTLYPEVPAYLLPASGSFDEKKAVAEKLKAWKGSTPAPAVLDPVKPWYAAGSIQPASDAEALAHKQAEDKKRQEARDKGDVRGVVASITSNNTSKIARMLGFTK